MTCPRPGTTQRDWTMAKSRSLMPSCLRTDGRVVRPTSSQPARAATANLIPRGLCLSAAKEVMAYGTVQMDQRAA